MRYKKIAFFHIINIVLLIIIDNIHDWWGNFYIWGLIVCIVPNFIGLLFNLFLFFDGKTNLTKFFSILILFCTNEIAFGLFEKRVIFFGLYPPVIPLGTIPVDEHHYFFISSCSIIAACAIMFISFKVSGKVETIPSKQGN